MDGRRSESGCRSGCLVWCIVMSVSHKFLLDMHQWKMYNVYNIHKNDNLGREEYAARKGFNRDS